MNLPFISIFFDLIIFFHSFLFLHPPCRPPLEVLVRLLKDADQASVDLAHDATAVRMAAMTATGREWIETAKILQEQLKAMAVAAVEAASSTAPPPSTTQTQAPLAAAAASYGGQGSGHAADGSQAVLDQEQQLTLSERGGHSERDLAAVAAAGAAPSPGPSAAEVVALIALARDHCAKANDMPIKVRGWTLCVKSSSLKGVVQGGHNSPHAVWPSNQLCSDICTCPHPVSAMGICPAC